MDLEKLKALFPQGHLENHPHDEGENINLFTQEGYFILPKKYLSQTELGLIELLAPKKHPANPAKNHHWYKVLFENEHLEITTPIRIIQIRLKTHGSFLQKEWRSEINDMFLQLADSFFINEEELILVEEKNPGNYPVEEIFGLFQALDTDFDVYTQVFVGAFHHEAATLGSNFLEEQQIFHRQVLAHTRQKDFPFTSSVINHFTSTAITESPLMNSLYREWFNDPEMVEILTALWENQGNVSSAAKELFLHRNTVLYRLDKFQETTRLDVKNMDDLVFCHLLISIFGQQD